MLKCGVVLFCALMALIFGIRAAFAEDGIPDNCETGSTPQLFPRYENGNLLLVDWTTGDTARTLESGLAATQFMTRGWSADCRYLVGSVITGEIYDTVAWDAVNGGRIGAFTGGRQIAHPLTWLTAERLIIETRSGAYLWTLAGNIQTPLTTTSDGNARSFSGVRLENGQILATLAIPPRGALAVYDLNSGTLLSLTDASGSAATFPQVSNSDEVGERCISRGSTSYANDVRIIYQAYNRQIVLVERSTNDLLRVIETDVDLHRIEQNGYWSANCRYLAVRINERNFVVYDLGTGTDAAVARIAETPETLGGITVLRWSPDEQYVFLMGRYGVAIVNLATHQLATQHIEDEYLLTVMSYRGYGFREARWEEGTVTWYAMRAPECFITFDLNSAQTVNVGDPHPCGRRSPTGVSQAEDRWPADQRFCEFTPYYSFPAQQLSLIDVARGREVVEVIETGLVIDGSVSLETSRTCRYIVGHLRHGNDGRVVIWDLETNRRVGEIDQVFDLYPYNLRHFTYGLYNSYQSWFWTPDDRYLLLQTDRGAVLWDSTTSTQSVLWSSGISSRSFIEQSWVLSRGLLLAVAVGADNGVMAFDLASGQQVGWYPLDPRFSAPATYFVSDDGSRLVVYTDEANRPANGLRSGIIVYHLDNGQSSILVEQTDLRSSDIRLSPDGRFVVAVGQYTGIDVWDLQNPTLDGTPNYRHQILYPHRLRFLEGTNIGTFYITRRAEGYWNSPQEHIGTVYRYDLITGELIDETPGVRWGDFYTTP